MGDLFMRNVDRRSSSNSSASTLALAALVLACATGAGCKERDPIFRVQDGALPKQFFVGQDLVDPSDDPEFFWRNYVVDGSVSQSLVGIGSWSHVDRVRWEVTEDLLIARKAYQIADGQDDKGIPQHDPLGARRGEPAPPKAANGTMVAAYAIKRHFDVRRSYNAQTGEETNVIEENDTDRPWHQREYMRVDWSKNLVGSENPMWNDMFTGKVFGQFEVLPVSYAVTDPNSDDAVRFEYAAGYLDVTNRFLLTPAASDSPFVDAPGKVPTCIVVGIFTGSSTYDCNPQEAIVRSSFLKIDPAHDFEPLENTRATMDVVGNPGGIGDSRAVGVVGAGRQAWDPQYGYTDESYRRFAYIHNVWKESHQPVACASNDDLDRDGTADECARDVTLYEGSSGAQCDVHVGRCTIPVRDRDVKTIGYFINKEAPGELQDPLGPDGEPVGRGAFEEVLAAWDQLMRIAVATAREVECRRTGDGDRASCHAEFFDSTADPATKEVLAYGGWLVERPKDPTPVLTMCHNPVRSYDLREPCGEEGHEARVGDLRHHFIFYWPYDSRAPWGGIANWNADPLTGEIIGAAAQIMGRSATMAAAHQRDLIQLALGDTTIEDLVHGSQEQRFSKRLVEGRAPTKPALTVAEMKKRVDDLDLAHLAQTLPGYAARGLTRSERLLTTLRDKGKETADPRRASTALLEWDALASTLRGTKYEAELVDAHWLVGALALAPHTNVDDAVLDAVSPLRGLDPGRRRALRESVTANLHARGVCFLDDEAPADASLYLSSLAGWFGKKYGDLDREERGRRIYDDLWKEAVKGIALHEIGHTLGLLHQFASSWDAPNYLPQYWQLRSNDGASAASCEGRPRGGDRDSCMGPRYLDPETRDEEGLADEPRPGILYFASTSTMEYQAERGGETVGLGLYDQHAVKALYGRVLETFDDGVIPPERQHDFRFKNWSQLVDRELVIEKNALTTVHYTELARRMKVFDPERDCRPATDEERRAAGWRVVHGKVCSPPPKDHFAWRDFQSGPIIEGLDDFHAPYWHVIDRRGVDRVRWPYRWGVSHNSYLHTNGSDAGADAYEVAVNTATRFEQTYPWTHFRRKNREYDYRMIPSAVASRYFDRMRSYHWQVATSLARNTDEAALSSDDELRPMAMAQAAIFDMLAKAVLMPEPGTYYSASDSHEVAARQPVDSLRLIHDVGRPRSSGLAIPAFSLDIGDGRFVAEEFNDALGGSWDYLSFINHAGFSIEKGLALMALVDGRPSLTTISRDNYLDGRSTKVNFRNDLPHATDRLIGGILAEDWESVAPSVTTKAGGALPELIDLKARTSPPSRRSDALVVFPNIGYKHQLATVMFSALFSRLNTDMSLMNKLRVWIDGQVGEVDLPDDEKVKFTDPASGYTYVARRYGAESIDGKSVDRGIASRMLLYANALVAAAYEVERDAEGEVERDAFGRPTLVKSADGQPTSRDPALAGKLAQYVGLVDAVREIGQKLGFGPLGAAR